METKQKMFRFTPRTVDLLKVTAGLNGISETEMLEIAIEMVSSPDALQLINSIHGERVSRKSLRKPRTIKQKEIKEDPCTGDKKVLSVIESIRDRQIETSNIKVKETIENEYIDDTKKEIQEKIETPEVSLDMIDDNLLEMYS